MSTISNDLAKRRKFLFNKVEGLRLRALKSKRQSDIDGMEFFQRWLEDTEREAQAYSKPEEGSLAQNVLDMHKELNNDED